MNYECEYRIGQRLYCVKDTTIYVEEVLSIKFMQHQTYIELGSSLKDAHYEPLDFVQSHYYGRERFLNALLMLWETATEIKLSSECKKQIQNAIEWELTSL